MHRCSKTYKFFLVFWKSSDDGKSAHPQNITFRCGSIDKKWDRQISKIDLYGRRGDLCWNPNQARRNAKALKTQLKSTFSARWSLKTIKNAMIFDVFVLWKIRESDYAQSADVYALAPKIDHCSPVFWAAIFCLHFAADVCKTNLSRSIEMAQFGLHLHHKLVWKRFCVKFSRLHWTNWN